MTGREVRKLQARRLPGPGLVYCARNALEETADHWREIDAPHGHDAFLLDTPQYHAIVRSYLARIGKSV